jgi:hypothetical protein
VPGAAGSKGLPVPDMAMTRQRPPRRSPGSRRTCATTATTYLRHRRPGGLAQAGAFLSQRAEDHGRACQDGGLIVITFDEGSGSAACCGQASGFGPDGPNVSLPGRNGPTAASARSCCPPDQARHHQHREELRQHRAEGRDGQRPLDDRLPGQRTRLSGVDRSGLRRDRTGLPAVGGLSAGTPTAAISWQAPAAPGHPAAVSGIEDIRYVSACSAMDAWLSCRCYGWRPVRLCLARSARRDATSEGTSGWSRCSSVAPGSA